MVTEAGKISRGKSLVLVALISISLISLEIIWTRIFSAEFFYNFAFLILSLAILGLGLGALSLRLFRPLNKPQNLGIMLAGAAFFSIIGPAIVLHLGFEFSALFNDWIMVAKFLIILFLLSSSFLLGGMAISLIFKQHHRNMSKLYMADLIGAGIGVFVAVTAMNLIGTPHATLLLGLPIILAAFLTSKGWRHVLPAILIVMTVTALPFAKILIEKPRTERAPVMYKYWDSMCKLKIYGDPKYPDYRGINIDNVANSPVYRFDGNWELKKKEPFQFGINLKYLINLTRPCTFMSLGAGGGTDVLQALQEGAEEIHAVEVNPHINDLMTKGALAEFSGNIYHDPRVKVATEDARAYVRKYRDKFTLIFSLSSNTFAALASGAFALAENYLFTIEAFEDYLRALHPKGFLVMEHQFYMPRIVGEAMEALRNLGVKDPENHLAVYNLPKMRRNILLLGKSRLTEEIRQHAFGTLTPENHDNIHLLYPVANPSPQNLIHRIVTQGWRKVSQGTPIDISPSTDNKPFTAQLGKWSSFDWEKFKKFSPMLELGGFPLSKLLIAAIILIILALIIPLNILPYFTQKERLSWAGWVYFFAIGAGFMMVEVILIQRYTLFIGPSAYTVMSILFTILLGSGIGSRFSTKFGNVTPFLGILTWLILEIFVFKGLTAQLAHLDLIPRVLISILLIFPLGFFMGMPFPKGTKRVKTLIDWGFAVNGAASVFGSALVMLISFSYGFNVSLLTGAGFYVLALLLMSRKENWQNQTQ